MIALGRPISLDLDPDQVDVVQLMSESRNVQIFAWTSSPNVGRTLDMARTI